MKVGMGGGGKEREVVGGTCTCSMGGQGRRTKGGRKGGSKLRRGDRREYNRNLTTYSHTVVQHNIHLQ